MKTPTKAPQTREQWLIAQTNIICAELFKPVTTTPKPPIRVSIGWPLAAKTSINRIGGQCFKRSVSKDGHNEIFLTPTLGNLDSIEILSILIHELVHAYDDCTHGHGKEFKKLATAVGLEGPMRSTTASDALKATLSEYVALLGPIPHAPLNTNDKSIKRQKNRQLLIHCNACDAKFRASAATLGRINENHCICCGANDSLTFGE